MGRMLGLGLVVSVLGAVSATGQQADLPYGDLVAAAGEQIANQCVRLLDTPSSANELAERAAEMSKTVFCDCMPPAIEGLGRARAANALIDSGEFGALVL